MLDNWMAHARNGGAYPTQVGWEVHGVVDQDSCVLTADHAMVAGKKLILHAVGEMGLPAYEVISEGIIDARYWTSQLEVIGSKELASLLKVSRQRVAEMRAEGRLPEPAIQLAATPVWFKRTIDQFIMGWPRKPGPTVARENFEATFE
jgi:hypothetical protein